MSTLGPLIRFALTPSSFAGVQSSVAGLPSSENEKRWRNVAFEHCQLSTPYFVRGLRSWRAADNSHVSNI